MTRTEGKNITINYGDFGLRTPITITNVLATDVLKFEIYNSTKNEIVKKTLPYENGKWIFELTEEETKRLEVQEYMYKIVQYRDGALQNTINKDSIFRVE